MTTVAEKISTLCVALRNCEKVGNSDWAARHRERLRKIEKEHLPCGAGFDAGSKVDVEQTTADKIVIQTSFHHMGEHGMYDGWTEHAVTAKPTFLGLEISVDGVDQNEIKDYIAETFSYDLGLKND